MAAKTRWARGTYGQDAVTIRLAVGGEGVGRGLGGYQGAGARLKG